MNPDLSADWASAILGLHQVLAEHLNSAKPSVAPVRLPDTTDWLQMMGGMSAPGLGGGLAVPPGFDGLAAPSEGDAAWRSAAQRYHEAAFALQAAWLKIGDESLDVLREALDEASVPRDLRGIYDLWVRCAEAAFARQRVTEHYSDLVSELINAQVALLLASGIGSAPQPDDPAALKEALAAAKAREARLRADLEALRQTDTAPPSPAKKRVSKKSKAAATAKTAKKSKAGPAGTSQKAKNKRRKKGGTKGGPGP